MEMQLIDALKQDYESTLGFIDKCDDHMFKMKTGVRVHFRPVTPERMTPAADMQATSLARWPSDRQLGSNHPCHGSPRA